ncbi:MAG: pgmB [Eubacterium sp.]|jgi:beta-phosphoglucomutase|nr:pgmB [Eubacterium sp.]
MYDIEAYIFDLDGVVVNTAKYHYLAWKRLAAEFGYDFTEEDNEQFKGVSRMACMDILAVMTGRYFKDEEKIQLADRKNNWYIEYIGKMQKDEVLPGFVDFITEIRIAGGRTALASASKNAALVLERLELGQYFDQVVDGNDVQKSKPDPQVFLLAAKRLEVEEQKCLVFEDAQAGIDAAKSANMLVVGIGKPDIQLKGADIMKPGFDGLVLYQLLRELNITDVAV